MAEEFYTMPLALQVIAYVSLIFASAIFSIVTLDTSVFLLKYVF
jgi:hypothetical protein